MFVTQQLAGSVVTILIEVSVYFVTSQKGLILDMKQAKGRKRRHKFLSENSEVNFATNKQYLDNIKG